MALRTPNFSEPPASRDAPSPRVPHRTERGRDRERERERQGETETERGRDRDRERERQRQREGETETGRDTERQTPRRESGRERNGRRTGKPRHAGTQKDRDRQSQRQRERQRETERGRALGVRRRGRGVREPWSQRLRWRWTGVDRAVPGSMMRGQGCGCPGPAGLGATVRIGV